MAGNPELKVVITGDVSGARNAVGEADGLFGGMSARVSGVATAVGTAVGNMALNAATSLVGIGVDSIGLAQQMETLSKKADTVFGAGAADIRVWADSVNESFGLSDEAVVGLAANMGDLLVPLGFTREEAANMSQETVNMAGALSAWSGGAVDAAEVSDILTKAYLGETDGLKQLGISISADEVAKRAAQNAAEGLTFATEEQAKAFATQQLITEKSTDAQTAWADGTMDATKKSNEMKAAWEDAKVSLGNVLLPIVQGATAFFVDTFIPAVRDVVASFQENWPRIREIVTNAIEPVVTIVTGVVNAIMVVWGVFGETIISGLQRAWSGISTIVQGALDVIRGIFDIFAGIFSGDWSRVWDGIQQVFQGVWDAIGGIVELAVGYVQTTIGLVCDAIGVAWGTFWGAIQTAINTVWEAIKTLVDLAIKAVGTTIETVTTAIGTAWDTFWTAIQTAINTVWDAIKELVQKAIDAVALSIKTATDAIKLAWDTVWGGISTFVHDTWETIKTTIGTAIDTAKTKVSDTLDSIKTKFGEIWDGISTKVSEIWEDIKTNVSNGIDGVVGFVTELPGKVSSAVAGAFDGIWDSFKGVINKIVDGWNNLSFTMPSISFDWNGPLPGGNTTVGGWTLSTPNLPRLAVGTDFFTGGFAMVGEQGPELVRMPRGSQVFTANETRGMMGGRTTNVVNTFIMPAGARMAQRDLKRWSQINYEL